MTDNEKAVMTDCYRFLNEYGNPPSKDSAECDEWWDRAATAFESIAQTHKHHPLAVKVSIAVYEYLEEKWHAINRKRGLE